MEWLSAEEKSRSMMPYLLDLPPLDQPDDHQKATITELKDDSTVKTKSASKKKTSQKELETEK